MLWYDSFSNKNSTNFYSSLSKKTSYKLNRYGFNSTKSKKFNKYLFTFILPINWNLIIIFNKNTSMYYLNTHSSVYYMLIPIFISTSSLLKFDVNTNLFFFQTTFFNNFTPTYFTLLTYFYTNLVRPTFYKLKFKGKGYYIYKNSRNTITPQFGYSHRLYLYAFFINVTFLTKSTLLLFGLNYKQVNFLSQKIYHWRPVNIFTNRGVRFSKQIIYKKSGKVSTYR
jgi:hypothetical protein